ncbi:MAG: hypothetical protein LDL31_09240 [Prosthecobacter sp.]|jgi:squalene-hopene/tetraprenyl-beta-curcumene cyclase|nr:hypothetical protein [Prosthecobacter sp.]
MKILPLFLLLATIAQAAETPTPKPKPQFQYHSGSIQVSLPSADEPKVRGFGPDSVQAALRYLEEGALCWVREKSCVNCHTTGPYLSERPAWSNLYGKPTEEILADFASFVPAEVKKVNETTTKTGHRHYPAAFTSVWRSLGLAEWDQHVTGHTREITDRSLRDMFERQSENGAFVSHGEVEIPHITTDFELSLQAARAITAAPGWLAGLQDAQLLERITRLKNWLRSAEPNNDFDRILHLQLAHYFPELVTPEEKTIALEILTARQHPDGGWSIRDMSTLQNWHFEISETVTHLIQNLPDAHKPESDAYMTALAIVLMRQAEVPSTDDRIQRGIAWLKGEQRISGRWWMHSLYRGNYHYITYIATCQALKALHLCGELPAPEKSTR